MKKFLPLVFCVAAFQANAGEADELIGSIQSVEQVKSSIRKLLKTECGSGSCGMGVATAVCEQAGALDVAIGKQITDPQHLFKNEMIPISRSDLRLMQKIWSQCKPTTYLFLEAKNVVHVAYLPTDLVAAEVKTSLGVGR